MKANVGTLVLISSLLMKWRLKVMACITWSTDRWLCLVTGDLIANQNVGILIMVSSMFAYFSVYLIWWAFLVPLRETWGCESPNKGGLIFCPITNPEKERNEKKKTARSFQHFAHSANRSYPKLWTLPKEFIYLVFPFGPTLKSKL
jgi:hypothetical protein